MLNSLDINKSATADPPNLIIIDNTQNPTQAIVPFLGPICNPIQNPVELQSGRNKKPIITDFFKTVTPNKLSPLEMKLLEKCLSFCPTHNIDSFQFFFRFTPYSRKLTLKRFFLINEQQIPETTSNEPSQNEQIETIGKKKNIKGKSDFYPTASRGNFIDTFHGLVQDDLEQIALMEKVNFKLLTIRAIRNNKLV